MLPIKTTLTINAISSGFTGLALIIFQHFVAALFEVKTATPFLAVGIFLVGFALVVLRVALQKSTSTDGVRLIIALDMAWVVGSLVLIVVDAHMISGIGLFAIAAVAGWVAFMVVLQVRGLQAMRSAI
jgi:hypothetical protein